MILFKKAMELAGYLQRERSAGKKIGFVPTMGALHPGHISLIEISKKNTELTACSIFVNPTQFNDSKDFQKYPVTIEKDIYLLEKAGTDVLFLPELGEMYPGGTNNLEKYDLGRLEEILEGKYRPGHFQGVAQVMHRLLDMVQPHDLFMGQKDYQQCMVVSRLLKLMGLPEAILHPCPILREADGLAMSSRNLRLTEAERKNAPAIYQALTWIRMNQGSAPGPELKAHAKDMLEKSGFRVDYVEIADASTLEAIGEGRDSTWAAGTGLGLVALVAAFQGEVRLIDNMLL